LLIAAGIIIVFSLAAVLAKIRYCRALRAWTTHFG
jgi:hypothetical protein